MTLTIKPVKLNQTIYFRVPRNIADLVGLDSDVEITLNIEELDDKFLLKYNVAKPPALQQLHPTIQRIER